MSKLETAIQQSPLQNGLQNGRDLTPLQASAYDFESLTNLLPLSSKAENNEGVLNFEPIYSYRDSNLASAAAFKDELKTIKREDGVDPAFKKEDPANKHRWNWRF